MAYGSAVPLNLGAWGWQMSALPEMVPAARTVGRSAAGTYDIYGNGCDHSGLRQLAQPVALLALSIGSLEDEERSFCRSVMFTPRLSPRETRRLHGLYARACRSVGL